MFRCDANGKLTITEIRGTWRRFLYQDQTSLNWLRLPLISLITVNLQIINEGKRWSQNIKNDVFRWGFWSVCVKHVWSHLNQSKFKPSLMNKPHSVLRLHYLISDDSKRAQGEASISSVANDQKWHKPLPPAAPPQSLLHSVLPLHFVCSRSLFSPLRWTESWQTVDAVNRWLDKRSNMKTSLWALRNLYF